MAADGDTELARCWEKIETIRAKQKAKPKHSPLPESVVRRPAWPDDVAPRPLWTGGDGVIVDARERRIAEVDTENHQQLAAALCAAVNGGER